MSNYDAAAVLFVKHLDTVARFYQQVARMRVLRADPDHVVLEGGAFQLVVHQIPAEIAKDIDLAAPPRIRESCPAKICYRVTSIESARGLAAQLGGVVYGPECEWTYDDTMVCDGYDPEGNVFQLFERKDAAEVILAD